MIDYGTRGRQGFFIDVADLQHSADWYANVLNLAFSVRELSSFITIGQCQTNPSARGNESGNGNSV
jgi:hypothetical protein